MSKKSRRRNKKLLTALAALGGAAMLAGRGKKDATVSTPTTIMDNMPKNIDKVIEDVSVSTPTTIQDSQVLGRMRGNVTAGGGFQGQSKRANYANRMRNLNADINRNNMLRAIRSNVDIATTPDSILQGVPEAALMAKDGGKIVKGEKKAVRPKKKTRIQIRGFGKARK
jgi:hypothetical protein